MERGDLRELILQYAVFLVSVVVHEAAHALVAWRLGDDTAYRGGQVTLNPWPHIRREPFGTVFVPLLSYFSSGFIMGWASAPFDRYWANRYPRRAAAMAAAGPAANLLLAFLAFLILKGLLLAGLFGAPDHPTSTLLVEPPGDGSRGTAMALSTFVTLNLWLFILNLVPLPPLDGSGIVAGLFPSSAGRLLEGLKRSPAFSLLGLLAAWKVLDLLRHPAMLLVLELLHPGRGDG